VGAPEVRPDILPDCIPDYMTEQAGHDGAYFSLCRKYRPLLWREWYDSARTCVFIGLNPSTATHEVDDPTIRRCIGFAKAWGFGAFVMLNLFDYRATKPADMKAVQSPCTLINDAVIHGVCMKAGRVVCAWGNHGAHLGRDQEVLALIGNAGVEPVALGVSKTGQPKHPLYIRADTVPVPYATGLEANEQ